MAQEIPLRYKYRGHKPSGTNKSTSGNSGSSKHRGESDKTRREVAQAQTRANQKVLVITASGKKRWVSIPA